MKLANRRLANFTPAYLHFVLNGYTRLVISRRWGLDVYAKPEVELGHLSKAATQKYNTSPWVKFGLALWGSLGRRQHLD